MVVKAVLTTCSDNAQVPNMVAHQRWVKITCFFALAVIVMIGHLHLLGDPADVVFKDETKQKFKGTIRKKVDAIDKDIDKEPLEDSPLSTSNKIDETEDESSTEETITTTEESSSSPDTNDSNDSKDESSEAPSEESDTNESPEEANSPDETSSDTNDKTSEEEAPEVVVPLTNFTNTSSSVETNETFVERWCELQGADWKPTGEDDWQLRAPYFLLPGAKKSGTTSLASYIMQHPQVIPARTKELQFFLNKNFRGNYVTGSGKTAVQSARQVMYARDYHVKKLVSNSTSISFDGTPGYLFFSSMLPQRILCVAPWIKLVVVLRNPVDRAYSNWAYAVRAVNLKKSFEEFVVEDFNFMKEAGLVHDWNQVDFDAFSGSQQEDDAWREYLRLTKEGPIGRGMYEIQLRHWYQAMKEIDRNPKKEILVIRTEDMKQDANKEYQKVLKFLKLPEHTLTSERERVVSNYTMAMNETTRQMLEDFYAPYNERLYKFMRGRSWKGYWERHGEHQMSKTSKEAQAR